MSSRPASAAASLSGPLCRRRLSAVRPRAASLSLYLPSAAGRRRVVFPSLESPSREIWLSVRASRAALSAAGPGRRRRAPPPVPTDPGLCLCLAGQRTAEVLRHR